MHAIYFVIGMAGDSELCTCNGYTVQCTDMTASKVGVARLSCLGDGGEAQ